MGIKGAWSLLSNDPRRFGQPWNRHDSQEHWIFLDGPSLLYHVAVKDVYDQYPPILQQSTKSFQQACPRTVHQRVTNFLSALLEAAPDTTTTQIHVVMDGLAPAAKIPTQVQRMAEQCEKSHNILHLQAESAMVEAIEDMMMMMQGADADRLHLHRPSHGEAETYIHQWLISARVVPLPRISILSNDTDFLIYSTCPGFVPFSTLTFTREVSAEGKLRLSGFEYLRSKFINAYFAGLSSDVEKVMAYVAALAGCDYACEHENILDEARANMIQSDIGGLRVKQRNNPSRALALVAILRNIGHYARHSQQQGDWRERMSMKIFGDSTRSEMLLETFREIHRVYFPLDKGPSRQLVSNESVELLRLLEHCTIFCRPLVETCKTSETSAPTRSIRNHARRKHGKRRRTSSLSGTTLFTSSSKQDGIRTGDILSESLVTVPPLSSQVLEWKSRASNSVWLMPHFRQVRLRLYSFINLQAKLRGEVGRGGPQWGSECRLVTEFVRLGRKEFGSEEIRVPPLSSDSLWDAGCSESFFREENASTSIVQMTLACITGSSRGMDVVRDELQEHAMLFLSSLMLPRPAALFLLLIGTAPVCTWNKNIGSLDSSLQEVLCMASVAWFHASLVCEAVARDGDSSLSCRSRVRVCNVFDNALAQIIWAVLSDSGSGDSEDAREAVFERLPAVFAREGSTALVRKDVTEWDHTSSRLWAGWLDLNKMSTEKHIQSADDDADWWIVNASARSLYANKIMPTATRVGKRARLFRFALTHVKVRDGQYLEFGVHEGKDIVRMAAFAGNGTTNNKVIFHGFDSFHGLPEDWDNGQRDHEGLKFRSGTFGLDGVAPDLESVQQELNLGNSQGVEGNIVLHPGWFEDTVPAFFDYHNAPIAFVHADADLYTSTLFFLDEMCKRKLLVRGSVIVFDEFTNYENWEEGEYRAWTEICQKYHIDFEYICYHAPGPNDRRNMFGYQSVGLVVTRVRCMSYVASKAAA